MLVDVAADGDRQDEILSRYGLTAETKRAEDLAWQTRMTADPTLRERFKHATAAYRPWR
ncbi:MAG: hypothetical protein WKG00_04625 [Polyangiaceae bacterium]